MRVRLRGAAREASEDVRVQGASDEVFDRDRARRSPKPRSIYTDEWEGSRKGK